MSLLQHPSDMVYKSIALKSEKVWREKDRGGIYLCRGAHQ